MKKTIFGLLDELENVEIFDMPSKCVGYTNNENCNLHKDCSEHRLEVIKNLKQRIKNEL